LLDYCSALLCSAEFAQQQENNKRVKLSDGVETSTKDLLKAKIKIYIGLGTHLFVKVPRPGGSEVSFSVFE